MEICLTFYLIKKHKKKEKHVWVIEILQIKVEGIFHRLALWWQISN